MFNINQPVNKSTMINQLRPNTTIRHRPIDDSFEDVCVVLNFDSCTDPKTPKAINMLFEDDIYEIKIVESVNVNAVKRRPSDDKYDICCKLLCFEDSDDFESAFESEPSTPTKPTVLTSTNAPERPKRF